MPATTVPVTIIGAFAAMAALGFGVNLLTLFALVLAIGIVVDDAIIVVEGSAKYVEQGVEPKQAAARAMNELLRPILAITRWCLLACRVPAGIDPARDRGPALSPVRARHRGDRGDQRHQRGHPEADPMRAVAAAADRPPQCVLSRLQAFVYDRLEIDGYVGAWCGGWCAFSGTGVARRDRARRPLAIWALTRLPTAFIPTEDQGYLMVGTQLPDGASLERTQKVMARVSEIARNTPGVEHVVTDRRRIARSTTSASLANAGIAYVILKDWSRRRAGEDLLSIFKALQSGLDRLEEARSTVVPPPPIQGLGLAGGFQMQVQVTDGTFDYRKKLQQDDRTASSSSATPSRRWRGRRA